MNETGRSNAVRPLVLRTLATAAVLAAIMAGVTLLLRQPQGVISIVAGAVMAMASFVVLVAVVVRSLGIGASARHGSVAVVAVIGCAKLVLLSIALWWLISQGLVTPVAFMAGFTSMVMALLIEGARLRRARA